MVLIRDNLVLIAGVAGATQRLVWYRDGCAIESRLALIFSSVRKHPSPIQ
jgi:hypothetical protein